MKRKEVEPDPYKTRTFCFFEILSISSAPYG